MADKNRPLHILKYLWDHTDEEHPAIITDILAHLEGCGIHTSVLSDSISSLNQPGTRLAEGQVFSLYQTSGQGAYTEKMYCMTANGAIPLGKR